MVSVCHLGQLTANLKPAPRRVTLPKRCSHTKPPPPLGLRGSETAGIFCHFREKWPNIPPKRMSIFWRESAFGAKMAKYAARSAFPFGIGNAFWRKMAKIPILKHFHFAPKCILKPQAHFIVVWKCARCPIRMCILVWKCIWRTDRIFIFGIKCIWRTKRIFILVRKSFWLSRMDKRTAPIAFSFGRENAYGAKMAKYTAPNAFPFCPKCIWCGNGKSFKTQLTQKSFRCMATRAINRKLETAATGNAFQTW